MSDFNRNALEAAEVLKGQVDDLRAELSSARAEIERLKASVCNLARGGDQLQSDLLKARADLQEAREVLGALTDQEGHIPHGSPGGPCTGECRDVRAVLAKAGKQP